MAESWNAWIFIFIIIASQGLLISALLLYQKPAFRWLGLAELAFTLLLGYYILFWMGNINRLPSWTGVAMGLPYLIGAFTVMQTRTYSLSYLMRLLIPFWLYISYFLWSGMFDLPVWAHEIQILFQCLTLILFAFLAHKGTQQREYKIIARLFVGFVAMHCLYYILQWTGILTLQQDYFVSMGAAVFMYGAAYVVYFKPKRSRNAHMDVLDTKLRNMLIERIEEDKLYLDSTLRLQSLSMATGLSTHQISELINNGGEKFSDLINHYRVKEAERLLSSLDGTPMSTTQIGYAAGFNNKTSFYTHFKRVTGLSPMKYRMMHGGMWSEK